jgi:hypothetical protein
VYSSRPTNNNRSSTGWWYNVNSIEEEYHTFNEQTFALNLNLLFFNYWRKFCSYLYNNNWDEEHTYRAEGESLLVSIGRSWEQTVRYVHELHISKSNGRQSIQLKMPSLRTCIIQSLVYRTTTDINHPHSLQKMNRNILCFFVCLCFWGIYRLVISDIGCGYGLSLRQCNWCYL